MRRVPDTLSPSDCAALVATFKARWWCSARNKALVALMLGSGLRGAEALALDWADLDLQSGRLWVRHGKGNRDRIVWLPAGALDILGAWRVRTTYDRVFCTRDGAPLQTRYVRRAIKRAGVRAGLALDVHPHMLRHTFATLLYRATLDLRIVQRALGHTDIRHTTIYTHVSDVDLQRAMQQPHIE